MTVKELVSNYSTEYRLVVLDTNYREIGFYSADEEIAEEVANLEIAEYKEEPELNFIMIRTNIDIKPKREKKAK